MKVRAVSNNNHRHLIVPREVVDELEKGRPLKKVGWLMVVVFVTVGVVVKFVFETVLYSLGQVENQAKAKSG